ncbi:MAG: M15 family metallopeptidase [Treponema sp.]|nr:M15 family metallopeptidase [Treponema sp.]
MQINQLLKCLILSAFALCFFSGCLTRETGQEWVPVASTVRIAGDLEAQHRILLAFEQGYPDKVSSINFINNDWTMLVNGVRFYYAHGRFLPEILREKWRDYLPYDFYDYPWKGTDAQRLIFTRNPVYSVGSSFLFDALYSSTTESEGRALQVKFSFLGVSLMIHQDVEPILELIRDKIEIAALTDPSINEWIDELDTEGYGWAWRAIAGTNRRSNHSYGIAIDLLPEDLRGRLTYWRWNQTADQPTRRTRAGNNNAINRETYYLPPDAVIKIFEDHGFIWGGNWALIDTMHFEYRPEILLLSGSNKK